LPDLDPDAAVERRDPKYFDWNVPVHRRMAFGILESQEPSRVRFDQPLPSEFVAVTASLKAASEAAWLSSADSSRTFGFVIKWPDGRTEPPAVLRYSGSLTPKADTQVANTTLIYRTPQGADSMQFEQRGYGHYNLDLYVAAATPAVRASANSTA
jgi:hypothetical protein